MLSIQYVFKLTELQNPIRNWHFKLLFRSTVFLPNISFNVLKQTYPEENEYNVSSETEVHVLLLLWDRMELLWSINVKPCAL